MILTQIYNDANFQKKIYASFMGSLCIVNLTKYINVNIKTSLFVSSCKNFDKYVMLYSKVTWRITRLSKLGVFNCQTYDKLRTYL